MCRTNHADERDDICDGVVVDRAGEQAKATTTTSTAAIVVEIETARDINDGGDDDKATDVDDFDDPTRIVTVIVVVIIIADRLRAVAARHDAHNGHRCTRSIARFVYLFLFVCLFVVGR